MTKEPRTLQMALSAALPAMSPQPNASSSPARPIYRSAVSPIVRIDFFFIMTASFETITAL